MSTLIQHNYKNLSSPRWPAALPWATPLVCGKTLATGIILVFGACVVTKKVLAPAPGIAPIERVPVVGTAVRIKYI